MGSRIAQWTIDAVNVEETARFWAAALDLEMDAGSDGCARLYPRNGGAALTPNIGSPRPPQPPEGEPMVVGPPAGRSTRISVDAAPCRRVGRLLRSTPAMGERPRSPPAAARERLAFVARHRG